MSLLAHLQALPEAPGPDVHVQLRKLAKTEAGRVIVRRYVSRVVGLLTIFPPVRSVPSNAVGALQRANSAHDWQACFEAGGDAQNEFAREIGAQLCELSEAARRDQIEQLSCRVLHEAVVYVHPFKIGQRVRIPLPDEAGGGEGEAEVIGTNDPYRDLPGTITVDWQDWSITVDMSRAVLVAEAVS